MTAFVSAGLPHSPANMGFCSLYSSFVGELDWGAVLVWNPAPAGLGDIISRGNRCRGPAQLGICALRASTRPGGWRDVWQGRATGVR